MPIMQALIVGGGQEEDFIYETRYDPSPKPLVTITPATAGVTSSFSILGARLLTVELWGGGGASGSARDGISGAGGAGGYVKAIVNVTDVPAVRIQVGGGGGTPDYYAIPSDEYDTENIADIVSVGTSSVNSQITLTTPFEVVAARTTTVATEGSNPAVSFVTNSSGSGVTSLIVGDALNPISVGDVIFVASSCDEGSPIAPTGFISLSNSGAGEPSYRLSYKYAELADIVAGQVTISGLQASITVDGVQRPVSHVAQVFRGVNPIATEGVISQGLQTNPGLPTLPDATSELTGCMLASFGFFDNVGLSPTVITAPTGHTNLISASSNSVVLPITPVTTLTGNTFVAVNDTDRSFTVSGLQAGDFVIVVAGSDGLTPANPTGWTSLFSGGTGPGRRVSYTFATGTSITLNGLSDPSNNADDNIAYAVLAFRNVDPEQPINDSAEDTNGTGNPDPPSVTTDIDGCMIVALGVLDDDSEAPSVTEPTVPAGFTLGPVAATGSTGDTNDAATVMSAYLLQTTAGTINPNAFGSDGSDAWSAHTLALSPLRIDSTVMAANRQLLAAGNYTNGSFGITTGASEPSVGTSILLVRNNNFVPSSSTMTITGAPLSLGDIIIVASVNDSLTPSLPTGFSNIDNGTGYRLSWKRVTDLVADSTVSGLTTLGRDNNDNFALIRHVAYVYRSASDLSFSTPPDDTGTIISPSDISSPPDEDLEQYACIPFAFIRNVSLTTGITPSNPSYTLGTIYPVGTNSTGISEATLVNAFRSGLPNNTTETPTDFAITSSVNWSSVTVALSPSVSSSTFSGSISLPVGTQVGDLVLVASVADGGTLNTPRWGIGGPLYQSLYNETNQTPSYQLSYKFIGSDTETTVDNLSVSTLNIPNGGGAPTPRGTAHTVQVFRGVNPLLPILSSASNPSTGNDNQPDPPSIGIASSRNAVVSFAFVDDKSVNLTNIPAGYNLGPVASVGTNPNSNTEATVMSAYTSTPTFPDEDPTEFVFTNPGDNWDAVTIALQNNITQRFSSDPGACGGSSGGFTALFDAVTTELILMVGGGGGGGGSSVIPSGSLTATPAYEANRSIGGSGGLGGGLVITNLVGNGLQGSDGLSFFASGGGRAIAGEGGGGGTQVSGGIGGNSIQNAVQILVSNPGETGVAYTNTAFGSRGANSPYNTADIPLQGANATGGYIAGRGGGSSRTDSTVFDAAIPSDCGGAGGAGYYCGGGGGPGQYGGGGGGGGGSAYYDPNIVTIISTESGSGSNPAGQSSEFWTFPIGVGGASAIGNVTPTPPGTPATTTVVGNGGGDGRVVITFFTVPNTA